MSSLKGGLVLIDEEGKLAEVYWTWIKGPAWHRVGVYRGGGAVKVRFLNFKGRIAEILMAERRYFVYARVPSSV